MGKRDAAVRQSGLMEQGETILGDETAIFTVAPGKREGGFVVQTDRAIYMCVQGPLGVGKVRAVHRLAVAKVLDQRLGHGGMGGTSWDIGFVARKADLRIGTDFDGVDPPADWDARMVVVSFRSATEGQRWSSLWDQAVRHHRGP